MPSKIFVIYNIHSGFFKKQFSNINIGKIILSYFEVIFIVLSICKKYLGI